MVNKIKKWSYCSLVTVVYKLVVEKVSNNSVLVTFFTNEKLVKTFLSVDFICKFLFVFIRNFPRRKEFKSIIDTIQKP